MLDNHGARQESEDEALDREAREADARRRGLLSPPSTPVVQPHDDASYPHGQGYGDQYEHNLSMKMQRMTPEDEEIDEDDVKDVTEERQSQRPICQSPKAAEGEPKRPQTPPPALPSTPAKKRKRTQAIPLSPEDQREEIKDAKHSAKIPDVDPHKGDDEEPQAKKAKKEDKQRRHNNWWFGTIYSKTVPEMKGFIQYKDTLKELADQGLILGYAANFERAKTGRLHWQVTMRLKKSGFLTSVQALFGKTCKDHWEICRNPSQSLDYCNKPETQVEEKDSPEGKNHYEWFADAKWDPRTEEGKRQRSVGGGNKQGNGQGRRTDLLAIYAARNSGESWGKIAEDEECRATLLQYPRLMDTTDSLLVQQAMSKNEVNNKKAASRIPKELLHRRVFWGPSGAGKSTRCRKEVDELCEEKGWSWYTVHIEKGHIMFNGYRGQEVIIIEDLVPDSRFQDAYVHSISYTYTNTINKSNPIVFVMYRQLLLCILDVFMSLPLPVKCQAPTYRNFYAVFITTNTDPWTWFGETVADRKTQKHRWARRFESIVHMDQVYEEDSTDSNKQMHHSLEKNEKELKHGFGPHSPLASPIRKREEPSHPSPRSNSKWDNPLLRPVQKSPQQKREEKLLSQVSDDMEMMLQHLERPNQQQAPAAARLTYDPAPLRVQMRKEWVVKEVPRQQQEPQPFRFQPHKVLNHTSYHQKLRAMTFAQVQTEWKKVMEEKETPARSVKINFLRQMYTEHIQRRERQEWLRAQEEVRRSKSKQSASEARAEGIDGGVVIID